MFFGRRGEGKVILRFFPSWFDTADAGNAPETTVSILKFPGSRYEGHPLVARPGFSFYEGPLEEEREAAFESPVMPAANIWFRGKMR